jgi:predicted RNA binding protein with dsRBD fold (UPF0201 family)
LMPDSRILVTAFVRVYVTEDRDRVVRALANMVRVAQIDSVEKTDVYELLRAVGHGKESLEPLRNTLRRQRTLDAARSYIARGMGPNRLDFHLHKQAAYVGAAVFCSTQSESPLGPISIRVECGDPQAVLDWLATPTVDGVPIDELGKRHIKRKPVGRHDNGSDAVDDLV